jgi:hypothetical protein
MAIEEGFTLVEAVIGTKNHGIVTKAPNFAWGVGLV